MKTKNIIFVRVHKITNIHRSSTSTTSHQLHVRLIPSEQGSFGKLHGLQQLDCDTTWTFQFDDISKCSLVFVLHEWAPSDTEVCRMTLPLTWFKPNTVVREIYPMKMMKNQNPSTMIDLDVHICQNGDLPFEAPPGTLTVRPGWKNTSNTQEFNTLPPNPSAYSTQPIKRPISTFNVDELEFANEEDSKIKTNLASPPPPVNPPSKTQQQIPQPNNFQQYPPQYSYQNVFVPPPYAHSTPPQPGPNGFPPLVYGFPPPVYYVIPQGITQIYNPQQNQYLPPQSSQQPSSQPQPQQPTSSKNPPQQLNEELKNNNKEILISEKQLSSEKNAKNLGAQKLEELNTNSISNTQKIQNGEKLDIPIIDSPFDDNDNNFNEDDFKINSELKPLDLDPTNNSKNNNLKEMKSVLIQ